MAARVLILAGGGVKSAVLAARAAADRELILLHADYGQPSAGRQWQAVTALADALESARAIQVTLPPLARVGDGPAGLVPNVLRGQMPAVLAVAGQAALRHGARELHVGLSERCDLAQLGLPTPGGRADHLRELMYAFTTLLEAILPDGPPIRAEAPLIDLDGAQIVQLAHRLEAPLNATWTCETAGPQPCGQCDPCRDRERAFAQAGVADPLDQSRLAPSGASAPRS